MKVKLAVLEVSVVQADCPCYSSWVMDIRIDIYRVLLAFKVALESQLAISSKELAEVDNEMAVDIDIV